jgi:hypothetical protein
MEEKLTEKEKDVLKHLAQITYEATMEAAKKYDEYKKAKTAARLAKKSHSAPSTTKNA